MVGTQELPLGRVGTAISHRQLKRADKTLGAAMVGWRACSAHRENEALVQEHLARLLSPRRLALIALPHRLCHLKRERLKRVHHQFGPSVVIEDDAQNLAGAMVQGKAPTNPRASRKFDL